MSLNRKGFTLSSMKMVGFMILVFVLLVIIPRIGNLVSDVGGGVSSFEEAQCANDFGATFFLKKCEAENSCTDDEISEWEKRKEYLGLKKCEGDKEFSVSLSSDEVGAEKDKACTCIQQKIWDLVNGDDQELVKDSQRYINSALKEGNYVAENIGTCREVSKNFNPQSILGTPYWVTTKGETGSESLLDRVGQVVKDTSGTKSYGNFGLNSKGGAISFWNRYGSNLGLKGTPGTKEADDSWKNIAKNKPEKLTLAEVLWYNEEILDNTINILNTRYNFPKNIKEDPRVIAYLSDVTIQEGSGLRNTLLNSVVPEEGESAENYLKRLAEYQASDDYLETRFKTYLSQYPDRIDALRNRILLKRYPLSLQVQILKLDENSAVECSS